MIVAKGKSLQGNVIIVGITEADIVDIRKGLTKTKQGNEAYGFSSLIVFMGNTDEEMIKTLNIQGARRSDDMFKGGQG